jgi:hypothetical protein
MAITLNGTTGITTPAIDNQGDLTVDTNTLFVDSANNSVGIGTSSPSGYDSRANNLVVGDAGDAGITIFSGATSNARLQFAPSGSTGLDNGLIGYDNSNDLMVFATGGSDRMRIDSTGAVTMPAQPAFLAIPTGGQYNFPINAQTTVDFANEIFDQGNNFSSNTFTAPVSGRYQFSVMLYANNMDTATDYYQCILATSNRTYSQIVSSNRYTADLTYYSFAVSILVDMDAGDTASVKIDVPNSGTAQLDLESTTSRFSGYLVC